MRRVKLVRAAHSQVVRIPSEFEMPGEEAIIRKEGQRLVIEPAPRKSLLALLSTLKPLKEDFLPIKDRVPDSCQDLMQSSGKKSEKP